MSNALAIAHVSQALALLIADNLRPEVDEAVKVEARKPPVEPPGEPTVSVFLYQVTPNTSQRNNDLPTRAADGTLVRRASAALDLHYLISAYGDEKDLVGQRLIGSVVRTLHETPVLPKDVVERAGERPYLAGSNLAEAVQRVRFTPTVMDIDETSKLWGMLHQTPYALSVVYQAALVLIDGLETPVPRKPVERADVRVLPFGAPGAPVPPGPAAPARAPATEGGTGTGDRPETTAGQASQGGALARTPARTVAKAAATTEPKTTTKAPAARVRRATKAAQPAKKTAKPAADAKNDGTDSSARTRRRGGDADTEN
ncbi:DUF4255 domain-containing protein [Streptomyces sp. DH24]|uniref:DUF4255 domain-containing protein n=1 Tax=Streptomyces sp. DH24 TaxID=3040123 RepID=UPI0024419AC4|nr:DUF4255 domain-containing protein [Streptomyces sp. DH24]MDG9715541.1 Pvc16 family protein [Streptomyces sp. DH24]